MLAKYWLVQLILAVWAEMELHKKKQEMNFIAWTNIEMMTHLKITESCKFTCIIWYSAVMYLLRQCIMLLGLVWFV